MPVLINAQTGLAEDVDPKSAQELAASGSHEVPLYDPDGNPVSAPLAQARELISQGYSQPTPEELGELLKTAKYSTPLEKAKTALEGAGESATFGLSTGLEKAMGATDEDIQNRREVNPGYHEAGSIAGLLGSTLTGVGEGKLLGEAGEGAAKLLGLGGEGAGVASKIGAGAAKLGTESALMSAGDEVSKALSNDPDQSVETAMANVGLSGLLGIGLGGAFGSVSPLFEAAKGSKLGKFIDDFKGQVRARANNVNPVESLQNELTGLYETTKGESKDVFGPNGIKAQAVREFVPEMSPKIQDHIQSISDLGDQMLEKLGDDPLSGKLKKALDEFKSSTSPKIDSLTNQPVSEVSSADAFEAADKLKKQLQEWGKFNKDMVPLAERDFRSAAKEMGYKIRTALEDEDAWGDAAKAQNKINSAFKEYKPALDDFEKSFTQKVAGERVIDPGKLQTYINQIGKAGGELKRTKLANYLEQAEKYRQAIADVHKQLGQEGLLDQVPVDSAKASLQKLTAGQRVANAMIDKGLARIGGDAIGAGVGAGVGGALGAPWIGAVLGEHALGPVFQQVLPSIAKAFMERSGSAAGLKSAVELGGAFIKGETIMNKAAKAVFQTGSIALPASASPSEKERDKIKGKVVEYTVNPEKMLKIAENTGYYMPNHANSASMIAGRAVQYLNSIRPKTDKESPLDADPVISKTEESAYDRQIDIANQPLLVFKHIKEGTLIPQDLQTLNAIYPTLYKNMGEKLTFEVINHKSDGGEIPYKTKISLSMFFAKPLDTTLTPQSIQSSQVSMVNQPQQPQGPANPPHIRNSPKALAKLGNRLQTGAQRAASARLES